ncbi:UDP-GlcNAc:betaGal beta-1,3-N-acetylglucosaminyltransferase 3 [Columba livia]|uniref:UDP-GlcNAc:betaGal beta-1,3-N-acetylglucosaminyltransferase 3 n=1 Tax=Columba livia TaxID=8932 RepID=A0A2I0LKC9_COLLI|nr:UDP-GlcNAc:betaGal beta-1,3-N-acetylglucosaminyltransferase 3 [Columba livia]
MPSAQSLPHLLQSTSLWHYRLDLRVLVAVGVLGLCYLFYQTVPLQKIPPSPNVSVHNISGFAKLPRHVQDFMRYRHCRSFPELLGVPGKCGGPEGSHNVFLLLAIKSSPANYERRGGVRGRRGPLKEPSSAGSSSWGCPPMPGIPRNSTGCCGWSSGSTGTCCSGTSKTRSLT